MVLDVITEHPVLASVDHILSVGRHMCSAKAVVEVREVDVLQVRKVHQAMDEYGVV
jgi:hypothetical protein